MKSPLRGQRSVDSAMLESWLDQCFGMGRPNAGDGEPELISDKVLAVIEDAYLTGLQDGMVEAACILRWDDGEKVS